MSALYRDEYSGRHVQEAYCEVYQTTKRQELEGLFDRAAAEHTDQGEVVSVCRLMRLAWDTTRFVWSAATGYRKGPAKHFTLYLNGYWPQSEHSEFHFISKLVRRHFGTGVADKGRHLDDDSSGVCWYSWTIAPSPEKKPAWVGFFKRHGFNNESGERLP